jgi:DNA-binding response OmpR family regulator
MQSGVFTARDSRTLLVDASIAHCGQLVEQLNHAGFKTDFAVSWRAAHTALRTNYYNSCVVVADLAKSADLEHLDELRRAVPRVWIIVLSDLQPEEAALALAHRQGIDAVLSTPFSVHDLASRLAAFSLRARPTF